MITPDALIALESFSLAIVIMTFLVTIRAYMAHELPIFAPMVAASAVLVAVYVVHIVGSVAPSEDEAALMFRLYLLLADASLSLFIFAFAYMKHARVPPRLHVAMVLTGAHAAFRCVIAEIPVRRLGWAYFRETARPVVVEVVLTSILVAWVALEILSAIIRGMREKRIALDRYRATMIAGSLLLLGTSTYMVTVLPIESMCRCAPIISFTLLPTAMTLLVIPVALRPGALYESYVRAKALLVFTQTGMLLFGVARDESLRERAIVIASVLSALYRFAETFLRSGAQLPVITFERASVIIERCETVLVCLLSDRLTPLHRLALARVRERISQVVVRNLLSTDIADEIEKRLRRLLSVLLGRDFEKYAVKLTATKWDVS